MAAPPAEGGAAATTLGSDRTGPDPSAARPTTHAPVRALTLRERQEAAPSASALALSVVYAASPLKRRRATRTRWRSAPSSSSPTPPSSPVTVRGLYYQAEVPGVPGIDKTENGYAKVQRQVLKLRRAGRLPTGRSRTRPAGCASRPPTTASEDALASTAAYRRNLWRDAARLRRDLVRKGRARRHDLPGDLGVRRAADGDARLLLRDVRFEAVEQRGDDQRALLRLLPRRLRPRRAGRRPDPEGEARAVRRREGRSRSTSTSSRSRWTDPGSRAADPGAEARHPSGQEVALRLRLRAGCGPARPPAPDRAQAISGTCRPHQFQILKIAEAERAPAALVDQRADCGGGRFMTAEIGRVGSRA